MAASATDSRAVEWAAESTQPYSVCRGGARNMHERSQGGRVAWAEQGTAILSTRRDTSTHSHTHAHGPHTNANTERGSSHCADGRRDAAIPTTTTHCWPHHCSRRRADRALVCCMLELERRYDHHVPPAYHPLSSHFWPHGADLHMQIDRKARSYRQEKTTSTVDARFHAKASFGKGRKLQVTCDSCAQRRQPTLPSTVSAAK